MQKARMERRKFLKGIGVGGLLLNPILASVLRAQSGQFAKRFIYFFTPNGTHLPSWRPPAGNASPGSLRLSSILAPLEAYRNRMTLLQGVHNRTGAPGDNHVRGVLSALTAIENNTGTVYQVNESTGYNKGKSLDQTIADHFGQKSIVAGCQSGSYFFTHVSSRGSNAPVTPESDPYRLHRELFSSIDPNAADLDAKIRMKKSVFDFARADIKRMQANLPKNLSASLSDHIDGISDLEKSFSKPESSICTKKDLPALDHNGNDNYPIAIDLQIKNVVYALSCGISNAAVIMCGSGVDNHVHRWVNSTVGHHDLSHDFTHFDEIARISNWYSSQFKKLLDLLDSVPEGNGTMLDHSIVLWGNELSNGYTHDLNHIPYVLAGGASGHLEGGRYFNWGDNSNLSHGNLLVSIANAMGINISRYNHGTGPLPDKVFKV